jgi:hypothetical protein
MLERERSTFSRFNSNGPALQAGILADDMGLGKTIEVLSLIHLACKLGLQTNGQHILPPGPTLICILPAVALD